MNGDVVSMGAGRKAKSLPATLGEKVVWLRKNHKCNRIFTPARFKLAPVQTDMSKRRAIPLVRESLYEVGDRKGTRSTSYTNCLLAWCILVGI